MISSFPKSTLITTKADVLASFTAATTLSLVHFRRLNCAAAASMNSPRLVPHPPDLAKWVKREGGFVHPALKVTQLSPYGLGLVASDEIPRASDLIALPPHLPLRFQSHAGDASSSILSNLADKVPEELWAMRLGLRLLQERAKVGTFWWPYISNLPETYSVPIFFQGDDIKNLQYAPILHQVNKRCRFLLEFGNEVQQVLENVKPADHPFEGLHVDASSLGWAMSAVSSRAFRLHGDGTHKDMPMMLPLIDMCNHSFNPNAKIIQGQDTENSKILVKVLVKVVSETVIRKDEALVLNYGCLSNDFFLLDYGFVIPANPYDCIELRYDGALLDAASMAAGVSSPNFSSPAPWQREILCQLKLDGDAPILKVTIGGPELVDGRLLAALRVLLANDAETVRKQDLDILQSLSNEAPLGISNEVATLRIVIALCMIALEHFPTKIMEDEALLKQGVSSFSELSIQFRIQKKALIVDTMMNLSKKAKALLSKQPATATAEE